MSLKELFDDVLRENRKLRHIKTALKSDFENVLRETAKPKGDKANCDDVMSVLTDMRIDNAIQRIESKKSDDLLPPEIGDIISKYEDRILYTDFSMDNVSVRCEICFRR